MSGPRVHGIDTPLTKTGRHQARRLNRHLLAYWNPNTDDDWSLRRYCFASIISSPMRRTLETALLLRGRMKMTIAIRTDVCERDGLTVVDSNGNESSDAGLTRPEIARMAEYITIPEDVTNDGWWDGRVEPHTDCMQRALRFAGHIDDLRRQGGHNVCVVTHGGFGDYLIRHLLHHRAHNSFVLDNTGITAIALDADSNRRRLLYHNRTEHLRAV